MYIQEILINGLLEKAKSIVSEAGSIVSMIDAGRASNDRHEIKYSINSERITHEDMTIFEVIQKMSEGNDESKKILCDIAKTRVYRTSKRMGYIFDMDCLAIRGSKIINALKFSGGDIFKLFEILDYETSKLMNHLEEIYMTGDRENG